MIFQFSSCDLNLQHTIPQDLMLPSTRIDGKHLHQKSPKGRHKKNSPSKDDVQKRLMHRKIEKRRRQEMSTLYASLRSLLPLEYIKGKRSVSDHMNEAVQYIKHLKNRIKELSAKRDKLRKLSNLNAVEKYITTSGADRPLTNVTINHCFSGLEVMFSGSTGVQILPLSRVMDLLLGEGLPMVNCVYTKAEQRWIYTIHVKTSDQTCIDCCALRRKLEEAILSSRKTSF